MENTSHQSQNIRVQPILLNSLVLANIQVWVRLNYNNLAPSPKDDLESLGFMLIYFLKHGEMFKIKEGGPKQKKMEEMKLRMIPEKFCKDLPIEILQYFQYIRMTNIS